MNFVTLPLKQIIPGKTRTASVRSDAIVSIIEENNSGKSDSVVSLVNQKELIVAETAKNILMQMNR